MHWSHPTSLLLASSFAQGSLKFRIQIEGTRFQEIFVPGLTGITKDGEPSKAVRAFWEAPACKESGKAPAAASSRPGAW